jgi:asparagine synthase (glutamine-hydrolysing)
VQQHLQRWPSLPDHRRAQVNLLEPVEVLDSIEIYHGYERVRLWYPFINKRLIEFCIAAPGSLKMRNGYRRYLIRAGLEGKLPSAIQWRVTKEPFSPDYALRYNRQRSQVEMSLAAIAANDPVREIVDLPRLQELAKLEAGLDRGSTVGTYVALGVLPRSMALIHFLRLL